MKIHLGCGNRHIPGYTHVDLIPYEHVDIVADLHDLPSIVDEPVTDIYTSHTLEHMEPSPNDDKFHNIRKALIALYDTLANDGTLHLSVPDFTALCLAHLENVEVYDLMGLLYGGNKDKYDIHHYTFTYPMLYKLLIAVGFREVDTYDPNYYLPTDYFDFSKATFDRTPDGRIVSLNIVATK